MIVCAAAVRPDLVQRHPSLPPHPSGALAARAATATVRACFETTPIPANSGLVASLNRPGGNITAYVKQPVDWRRTDVNCCIDLLPASRFRMAFLVDPINPKLRDHPDSYAGGGPARWAGVWPC